MAKESQFDLAATSTSGYQGAMQISRITLSEVKRRFKLEEDYDIEKPEDNLFIGILYHFLMQVEVQKAIPHPPSDEIFKLANCAYNLGPTKFRDFHKKYQFQTWDEFAQAISKGFDNNPDFETVEDANMGVSYRKWIEPEKGRSSFVGPRTTMRRPKAHETTRFVEIIAAIRQGLPAAQTATTPEIVSSFSAPETLLSVSPRSRLVCRVKKGDTLRGFYKRYRYSKTQPELTYQEWENDYKFYNGTSYTSLKINQAVIIPNVYVVDFNQTLYQTLQELSIDPGKAKYVFLYNKRVNPAFKKIKKASHIHGHTKIYIPQKILPPQAPAARLARHAEPLKIQPSAGLSALGLYEEYRWNTKEDQAEWIKDYKAANDVENLSELPQTVIIPHLYVTKLYTNIVHTLQKTGIDPTYAPQIFRYNQHVNPAFERISRADRIPPGTPLYIHSSLLPARAAPRQAPIAQPIQPSLHETPRFEPTRKPAPEPIREPVSVELPPPDLEVELESYLFKKEKYSRQRSIWSITQDLLTLQKFYNPAPEELRITKDDDFQARIEKRKNVVQLLVDFNREYNPKLTNLNDEATNIPRGKDIYIYIPNRDYFADRLTEEAQMLAYEESLTRKYEAAEIEKAKIQTKPPPRDPEPKPRPKPKPKPKPKPEPKHIPKPKPKPKPSIPEYKPGLRESTIKNPANEPEFQAYKPEYLKILKQLPTYSNDPDDRLFFEGEQYLYDASSTSASRLRTQYPTFWQNYQNNNPENPRNGPKSGKKHRPRTTYVILHSTDSTTPRATIDKCMAHFVVDRNGTPTYVCRHDYPLDHAGKLTNRRSSKAVWNNDGKLHHSSLGIEVVATKHQEWTPRQYETVKHLLHVLGNQYSLKKKNIIGHYQVACGRSVGNRFFRGPKGDPFKNVEWDLLGLPDNSRLIDNDVILGVDTSTTKGTMEPDIDKIKAYISGTGVSRTENPWLNANLHKISGLSASEPIKKQYAREVKKIKQTIFTREYEIKRHTVKKGDNLSAIAARYEARTQLIKDINNLRSSRILIGQRLKIPVPK